MVTGIRVLAAHQVGEGTPLVVTKTTTEQIQTVQDSADPVQGLMAAVHQVGQVVDRQVIAVGNPPPVEVVVTRLVIVVEVLDHLLVPARPLDPPHQEELPVVGTGDNTIIKQYKGKINSISAFLYRIPLICP